MKRVWTVYGLVQINTEYQKWIVLDEDGKEVQKEGYFTIVDYDGMARPVLKAPLDMSYGWKNLTAIYDDEIKQKYQSVLKRTLLYLGAKVYLNCPCIFFDENDKTITLRADLFYHNRRVPGGVGSFYHNNNILDSSYVYVKDGVACEVFDVPDELGVSNNDSFMFDFYANTDFQLAPAFDNGVIYVNQVPRDKVPLRVDVETVIVNEAEDAKLVARVYHKNYVDYVKYPDNLLHTSEGYVEFYIDGKRVETGNGKFKFDLNSAGFATAPFSATMGKGVHKVLANFYPDTPDSNARYVKTGGCGTLYIGDDPDKPQISTSTPLCTFIGNENKTITFNSNEFLKGNLRLYIDMKPVALLNSNTDDGSLDVNGVKTVDLSFDSLEDTDNENYRWNFTGHHNLALKYTIDDGDYYPLEFWYYLNDLYIQRQTLVKVDCELDNNTIEDNDENVYVGNNSFYINGTNPVWYSPHTTDKSKTIGNKLIINVEDLENPKYTVNEGHVRVTFITRYNKSLEENLDD